MRDSTLPQGSDEPPEVVHAKALVLRRATPSDAEALAAALNESLDHLSPWMTWVTAGAATVGAQTARLAGARWGPYDYRYIMLLHGAGVVGGCGLHRRVGPAGLEIAYWVHVRHVRRGYATAAVAALTSVALSLPGIQRVEVHCDEGNVASAAVPRRLGFRLDRVEVRAPESPAQTGRFTIWVKAPPMGPRPATVPRVGP